MGPLSVKTESSDQVQSASPVVDNKSPPFRGHVRVKLKKMQKEKERMNKIEGENFLLLKKMSYITQKHWMDNWLPPQPNFLSKIELYNARPLLVKQTESEMESDSCVDKAPRHSKFRCSACTLQKLPELKIAEKEIPLRVLPKEPVGRSRSKSVPATKLLPTIIEKPHSANAEYTSKSKMLRHNILNNETQKITLSRGSLKLSVNFPPDTTIKFDDGQFEKYLTRGHCHSSLKTEGFCLKYNIYSFQI
ncbi:uncharacterized protein LOC132696892 isoform X2 [Cylas formicarius]|uniref:uncharacterized protein LOC132696892 isoform X2 n=1 Tax=Cylas formicarius TaxID=197179 RepID=UPI002958D649|nr:uncharacterized protein LOC132696892 isoform X2 [Cylas formicarius]